MIYKLKAHSTGSDYPTKNYHASDYIAVYALLGLLGLSAGALLALGTMDKWL